MSTFDEHSNVTLGDIGRRLIMEVSRLCRKHPESEVERCGLQFQLPTCKITDPVNPSKPQFPHIWSRRLRLENL